MSEAETSLEVSAGPSPVGAHPTDPYVGRLIGDRYRILERLGEGGMGAVYRAEHTLMKKVVALKLLHRELGEREEAVRRFEREAQSASRLSHQSIIAVTDFGRAASGELFLVMEFARGEALFDVIAREGRLPLRRALSIVRQMLRGLAHAHAQGVVHRDLKPANVMVLPAGTGGAIDETIKILDFGIAKMSATSATEGGTALTQSGMIFGTPSYMSPEQATGQDADLRSDLYSCGILLYEMLAGRKPFVADDLVRVMAMQVTQPPPPFARTAPDANIPAALEAVVCKALEKDREKRFQSATEFLAALDEVEHATPGLGQRVSGLVGKVPELAVGRARELVTWVKAEPSRLRVGGGAAAIVLALIVLPLLFARDKGRDVPAPMKPKPVEPQLRTPLKRAEESMGQGKLIEARAMLMQQLSQHPGSGRVRFLLGTIDFLEKKPGEGLEHYEEALELDPGLRSDAALLVNVKGLLDDKKLGRAALDLLAQKVGRPASAVLADVATDDRRGEFRKTARDACRSLGCLEKVDLVRSYALDFAQAKTCDDKREAVQGLGSSGDAKAIEFLKKARRDRGGPLGGLFGGGNDCVRKDIDAALEALGAKG